MRKIPATCRPSLEIFCVQVLSNLSAHPRYAHMIAETSLASRMSEIVEEWPDHDLQKEACIYIRNSVSHKDDFIIKRLVDANILYSIMQYLYVAQGDEKSELPAVEALIDIFTVGQTQLSPEGRNIFVATVEAYAGFECFLNMYLSATGKSIDDMEHDDGEAQEQSDDEQSNLDAKPFFTLKNRLAARSKYIMRTWFLGKFQETLQNAMQSAELFHKLGSLTMDPETQKNSIMDLIEEFSSLMPNGSSVAKPIVSANRTESESTLA